MAQKDFFKKLKGAKDSWAEGRKGRGTGFVEVATGFKGIVRGQSMEMDVTEKGEPFIQITTIVVNAEDDQDLGARVAERVQIVHRKGIIADGAKKGEKWEITEADCFSQIATALQALGIETENMEFDEDTMNAVADAIADEQAACRIEVGENKKGYKYIKWGKPVDDDDLLSIEDVLDEDEAKLADDDDDDDDDEPADDADDEADPPEKGDMVNASPSGTRNKVEEYTIVSVNKTKSTCNLQRNRDQKDFKNQSFDVIKDFVEA